MKLERSLYQNSYLYFVVFFLFMMAAFWVSYFSELLNQENYRMHVHGVTLILWCVMLITQAYLIRTKHNALHKRVGKLSYVLVPLILYTTIDLFKYRLRELTSLRDRDYLFIASVLNALIVFLVFYGLAIYYRRKPAIHARYIICTTFPMFTAIVDRIIQFYFPFLLDYFPIVEEPVAQVVGLTLADLLVLGLCLWDGRSHKRWNVFPVALLVLLVYHYSVMYFYQYHFWRSFGDWFFEL